MEKTLRCTKISEPPPGLCINSIWNDEYKLL